LTSCLNLWNFHKSLRGSAGANTSRSASAASGLQRIAARHYAYIIAKNSALLVAFTQ